MNFWWKSFKVFESVFFAQVSSKPTDYFLFTDREGWTWQEPVHELYCSKPHIHAFELWKFTTTWRSNHTVALILPDHRQLTVTIVIVVPKGSEIGFSDRLQAQGSLKTQKSTYIFDPSSAWFVSSFWDWQIPCILVFYKLTTNFWNPIPLKAFDNRKNTKGPRSSVASLGFLSVGTNIANSSAHRRPLVDLQDHRPLCWLCWCFLGPWALKAWSLWII